MELVCPSGADMSDFVATQKTSYLGIKALRMGD
jgi:hypothetical protein